MKKEEKQEKHIHYSQTDLLTMVVNTSTVMQHINHLKVLSMKIIVVLLTMEKNQRLIILHYKKVKLVLIL